MLNRWEKEKINKVLERTAEISKELEKTLVSFTEIREKIYGDFHNLSTVIAKMELLDAELKGVLYTNEQAKKLNDELRIARKEIQGDAPGA